jgi:hypothetical protein
MNTIRSIAPGNSHRLPARLKLLSTRIGSLILLFQRMPVVQFLFPEANIIGGASVANTISLAVTTVVGLGAFDSVAGQTTINEVQPIARTGATSSRTTTANAVNVPATVSAPLNFEFGCFNAPSDPESWKIVTSGGASASLPTGLTMQYTTSTPPDGSGGFIQNNFITGTPTQAGTNLVYIRVYRDPGQTGDNVTQLFNICVLGFSTQPAATTSINSGQTTVLTCVATGNPVGTTRHPGDGTLTYEWYQGTSGTLGPILGTSASFTTPNLTSSTNYWVRIKSVLGTSTVYAKSNTAAVTVNPVSSPFDTWAAVLPLGQRGATQTPQNDGVTNLEKFAFNLEPLAPDVRRLTVGANGTAGLPGGAYTGGVLRLEFLRRKASTNPGITYTAQFGSDLGGWTDIPAGTPAGTSIDATWERVIVDDPTGGLTRFGRVKVAQTP